MQGMYSMRSPAVKRLMKEAQELREPTEQYACHPLEDNLFEWHFTIRGPADSDFDGGLYHGRIILPPEYPMKPPSIIILTPNGRFEVNKKICLSISGHHPESWQPSWSLYQPVKDSKFVMTQHRTGDRRFVESSHLPSLRTAMLAIIGFMPTHGAGALGSLDYTPEERKILAKRSQDFKCPSCGCINNILKPVTEESKKTTEEARELAAQIDFKDEKEKNAALKTANQSAETNGNTPAANEGIGHSASPQSVPGETPTYPLQQFGQFPFRMPFFPPFPQMNPQNANTGTTAASQVPRFPLPFVSPFYPPVMQSGNFPMLPMMPGMQVPPWQLDSNTTPVTLQSQPAGSASAAPIQSQTSGSVSAESMEATQPSSSTPATNDRADRQSENSSQPQTEMMTSSTVNTANSSSNDTVPSSPDGLRQRNVTTMRQTGSQDRAQQSAEFEQRDSQRTDRFLVLFAVFVVIVIALLLIRRLHMMKLITFPL